MLTFFKKLRNYKIILTLASLKITVVGLLLLFVLTFWGTIAQVENGLYGAQERYFSSFYFLAMGFLPFPGGQLVLWVLFVNLVCAFFTRIIFSGEKLGLIITHAGLILFLVAAFVILHDAEESHLTLREGEAANVSRSYSAWEVALWSDQGGKANMVFASDTNRLKENDPLHFPELGLKFKVRTYYSNAQAFTAPFAGVKENYLNAAGINVLKQRAFDIERERNVPGLILESENGLLVLLYGAEDDPTKLRIGEQDYYIILRHQRFPLPITVKLLDFMMEKHPGTETPRSFKSRVEVDHDGVVRETVISMNEPLRFKAYTFYQSSYQIDEHGGEISTLAVVKNSGRNLPYVATFVTFFGMVIHFLIAAFRFKRAKK